VRLVGVVGAALCSLLAGLSVSLEADGAGLRAGSAAATRSESGIGAARTVHNGKIALLTDSYLEVVNPDGSGVRRLTGSGLSGGKACSYPACVIAADAWSPDGTRLAFVRGNPGAGPGCRKNCRPAKYSLFVMDANGRNERRVAVCDGACGGPWFTMFAGLSWSPDSSRIVLSAHGLSIVDVATGKLRRLGLSGTGPAWSPDGRRIAYASGSRLLTVNTSGTPRPTVLIRLPRYSVDTISWAPNSQTIAFDGPDTIYTVHADGSKLTSVLAGSRGSGPGTPSWSPDGTKILYFNTPREPGGFRAEVWTMQATGAGKTRLVGLNCCVGEWYMPIWSPDGKQIAFAANGEGTVSGTYVMNANGTRLRQLLPYPVPITWQPLP